MSIMQIFNKYKVRKITVKYTYRLIEVYGYDILRTIKKKIKRIAPCKIQVTIL